jgi:hypothetical protein
MKTNKKTSDRKEEARCKLKEEFNERLCLGKAQMLGQAKFHKGSMK